MPQLTKAPEIIRDLASLRARTAMLQSGGKRLALVPTMGALHEGHLDLVRQARTHADHVAVSIFVNPRQFAPHEDLDRYPRDEAGDVAKLASVGTDLVWAPTVEVMYQPGFATRIEVAGAAEGLESDFRPHFFGGVATVVTKLLTQVGPDVAVFGEKDYQQLAVVRQLVRDLDLPVTIIGAATIREPDGLALSSRNAYLTPQERKIAPSLNAAMRKLADAIKAGSDIGEAAAKAREAVLASGFAKVDYIEVRDAMTLKPVATGHTSELRILAAAWLGKTRLIDNIGV